MQKTLNDFVYGELKRRILNKEYQPNEIITERSIAAEFNVSKTPVRESLGRLCQEGDIVRYSGLGYIIKDLSYTDALHIAELRCIVECAAADLIILYARDEEIRRLYSFIDTEEESERIGTGKNTTFHHELGKLTKNPYMEKEIRQLAMSAMRPSTAEIEGHTYNTDLHKAIVDALLARDPAEARRCLMLDIQLKGQRRSRAAQGEELT